MKQLGLSLNYLLDKKQELESQLATVHNLISCFYPSKMDSDIKKGPGRPKGSKNPDSLDSIILNALKASRLSCLKTQGLIAKEDNDLIFKLR